MIDTPPLQADGVSVRTFTPYSAYKNSGVDWLGEIPEHWQVKRLKQLAFLNPGALPEDTDPALEMVYVDIGGVDSLGRIAGQEQLTFATAPSRARRLVRQGDVIVSTVRTYLRAIAQISDPHPSMVVSTGFAVVRPGEDLTADFAAYALRAPYFVERVVANSKGVSFPAINESEMATYELATPSLSEQRAIAAFLDRETARIDALVAKKERLIELLQEQRIALITRTVTRGLDSSVATKNSGIEWLGEIPAHWDVKPLKHMANFVNGFAFKPDEWGLDGTPIIRIENLNGSDSFNCTTRDLPAKYCADEGDLLFGWSGNRGTSFGPFLWWRAGKHYVNQHIFRIVDYGADKMWLYWTLRGVTAYVEKQAHGIIGMVHVTRGELGTIFTPVPPAKEQGEIAQFLASEHARIDSIAERVQEAISRLNELRTALISAAVTGKIDVRGEAA